MPTTRRTAAESGDPTLNRPSRGEPPNLRASGKMRLQMTRLLNDAELAALIQDISPTHLHRPQYRVYCSGGDK